MLTSLQRVKSLAARRQIHAPRSCLDAARRWSSTIGHDPLRVLFCGADGFSIASLKALNDIRLSHPDKIASIDVVCRPGKRVGRGLKQIRELPIKEVAIDELNLPLHQIDTFTRWSPPQPEGQPINLVVAVSFGLFVPPRILSAAKYGGLNVHPSMLPDLRGSAPLHHALLHHDENIGVTLQTLDFKHFDHGAIVDQTPLPGIPIPSLGDDPVVDLVSFVAPLGAEILRRNIMSGSFVNAQHMPGLSESGKEPRHAPKTTPEDKHIQWSSWKVKDFLVRDRVLGRLWDTEVSKHLLNLDLKSSPGPRIIYSGWEEVHSDADHGDSVDHSRAVSQQTVGVPFARKNDPEKRLIFRCADGNVAPKELTIEGKPKAPASKFWTDFVSGGESSQKPQQSSSEQHAQKQKLSQLKQHPSKAGAQKRIFSTSTCRQSLTQSHNTTTHHHNYPSSKKASPQISWTTWPSKAYLTTPLATSSSPLLSDLLPHSSQQALNFTFHNFINVTIPYSKLLYRSSELFTPLPPHIPFCIGAPIFVSNDREKRIMFWVWADEERSKVKVISSERIEVEGVGMLDQRQIHEMFMGRNGKGVDGGARLVTAKELRSLHGGKWEGREKERVLLGY